MSLAVNRCYIQPITSAGVLVPQTSDASFATARGVHTLAAGTYYFPLPVGGATMFQVHLTHDAALAAVGTIETCGHGPSDVSDYSAVAGEWIDQDPSTAFVGIVGATTTQSNGVVTVVAGNAGGADWQVSLTPTARARLKLVVSTGGEVRVSFTGKN
jgi:hypothetical protein